MEAFSKGFIEMRNNYNQQHLNPNPDNKPAILAICGTGVSIVKIGGDEHPYRYQRISGSTIGGGTLIGMSRLLFGLKQEKVAYKELEQLSSKGDYKKVDYLIQDIYGSNIPGLPNSLGSTLIASSLAKLKDLGQQSLKKQDIADSLVSMVGINLAQICILNARIQGESNISKNIYFSGASINPQLIRTIAYGVDYWSKGEFKPYHHLKTAGILVLILGIGCILIGALLPYGLQLKISKEIQGKVKLDRDKYDEWGQIPGKFNREMKYQFTFKNNTSPPVVSPFTLYQNLQNITVIESSSSLDTTQRVSAISVYPDKAQVDINIPNINTLSLLQSIQNRDPSKIVVPAISSLLASRQKLYNSYIYAYYMFKLSLHNKETVMDLVLVSITDQNKKNTIYNHPTFGMSNYTGISKWVLVNLGDTGLQSAMMAQLQLTTTDITNIAKSQKSFFYSLQQLVHWRIGVTNECEQGCAPGTLMTRQHSTLGPLLTKMPDFSQDAGIPPIESVKYLMDNDDYIPMEPEIASFKRNLAKSDTSYETVELTVDQFSNLFSSNGKLLVPTNVLMLFENAKGNVGMADIIQRLDLGYMKQGNLVLLYLNDLIDRWSYWSEQGGDKTLESYSFLAREFMKNYLPNQIYQLAGDCAVYRITQLTFAQWIKVSGFTQCSDLITNTQLCSKFQLSDFFDARFYGPNSPQFAEACQKMDTTPQVLLSLLYGTQAGTYGGEFTTVQKYVSDTYSCADQAKCTGKDLGPLQWFNSTYTLQRLPGILQPNKVDGFICDTGSYFQLQSAAPLLHYKFDQVKLGDDSLDLMYGNNKSGVNVSLLDDYFMKRFLLFYQTNESEVKKRYNMGSPQFWNAYMSHAIEKHMLQGGANSITIKSQNVYDGILPNPLINYMKNGTYQQGYDQAIAQVNYLPRMVPSKQLQQSQLQLRSGHRDVSMVRTYNRFIDHAQIYKALFFYNSELKSGSRNQTLQLIPWANQAPIDGTDGTQFHPNLDGSQTLKFLDPIKYRALELEKDDDDISRDGLNLIRYKIKSKEYLNSNDNAKQYYQRNNCFFNLTSIYNVPILSSEGVDSSQSCTRNSYFLVDKLSGYTVEYQIYDTFYVNVEKNYALPSVLSDSQTEFYSLKRSYSRPIQTIKQQFKDVDDLYSYKSKIMLAFFISGGLLLLGGIAMLITVCCLRKKLNKADSYVFYEPNLRDTQDD